MSQRKKKGSSFKSRLLRGGTLLSIGRVAANTSFFFAQVMLARVCLTTADFGVYMFTSSLVQIASVVATFGVPPIIMRTMRESLPAGNATRAISAIRHGGVLMAATVLITAAVVALGLVLTRPDKFGDQTLMISVVLCAWIILGSINQLISQIFTGGEHYAHSILLGGEGGGLIPNGILMVAAAVLSMTGQTDLLMVFAVNLVGLFVAAVFSWRRLWATLAALKDFPVSEQQAPTTLSTGRRMDSEPVDLSWMTQQSWPVMVRGVLRICMAQLDVVLAGAFLADVQIAAYGGARSLVRLISSPLRLTNVAVSPFVPELNIRGETAKLQMLLRAAATTAGLPSLLCFIGVIISPGWVMGAVFGEEFVIAAQALRILGIGSIAFVVAGGCGMVLLMTGYQKVSLYTSTAAFCLQIIFTPLLLSSHGMVGAALATAGLMIIRSTTSVLLVRLYVGVWSSMTFSRTQIAEFMAHVTQRRQKRANPGTT